jgi:hypothetical protein
MKTKLINCWDYWEMEWGNARKFFKSKGSVSYKCFLKNKWNKCFTNILNDIYKKGFDDGRGGSGK